MTRLRPYLVGEGEPRALRPAAGRARDLRVNNHDRMRRDVRLTVRGPDGTVRERTDSVARGDSAVWLTAFDGADADADAGRAADGGGYEVTVAVRYGPSRTVTHHGDGPLVLDILPEE